MDTMWDVSSPGVLLLPSGRLVRGRALARPMPPGEAPQFSVFLLGSAPSAVAWDSRWVRWPDFRLPGDPDDAAAAFREAWRRADGERVEIACHGGHGRTGTALACIAILDGVRPADAVAFVRAGYDPNAVETRGQRSFVARFSP
jgi:hypothetical protein